MGADSLAAATISRTLGFYLRRSHRVRHRPGAGSNRAAAERRPARAPPKAPVDEAIGWGSIAALSFMTLCIALLDGVIMPLAT
ncbi:hypothetical protein ELQ87_09725 [Streptomyces griseoviridis]|nr:hypothetical protein [Streptomyces griseoviridis]AZS84534.1 hypothetical protein ELQ87_09725 [Streptomyces griseoviridis]